MTLKVKWVQTKFAPYRIQSEDKGKKRAIFLHTIISFFFFLSIIFVFLGCDSLLITCRLVCGSTFATGALHRRNCSHRRGQLRAAPSITVSSGLDLPSDPRALLPPAQGAGPLALEDESLSDDLLKSKGASLQFHGKFQFRTQACICIGYMYRFGAGTQRLP